MLEFFTDWQNAKADVYSKTVTQNSSGQIVETETLIATSVPVNIQTDTAIQTNTDDQFSNSEVGTIWLDPSVITFTPDNNYIFKIAGKDYYIEGIDDVGFFQEVLQLTYRKERK